MKVLAFDCSAARGSVAVVENGTTLYAEDFPIPRGRGSEFFAALDRAVGATGRADRIAVGVGPGSYNGLRTAVAAAEGLHLAWGAPRVGVISPRALPAGGAEDFFVLGDARGGMLWLARMTGRLVAEEFALRPAAEVRARLDEHPDVPRLATTPLADFPEAEVCAPDAAILAQLAVFETPSGNAVEPFYLKPAHITKAKPRSGVTGAGFRDQRD